MDARTVRSFDELAKRMGKKLPARGANPRKVRFNLNEKSPHGFPDTTEVMRRARVEAQGPLFTLAPVVELGDEILFSSRGLTDWYVGQYLAINHLKR